MRKSVARGREEGNETVKALIIGAPGQVGGALMHALAVRGHQTVGTYHTRPVAGMAQLDVADAAAVKELVTAERPQVIFLTGALTAVDYCEDHPDEAHRINVEGPRHTARAAKVVGATLVHYSTEYVFNGEQGPYGEDDPISPLGVYAQSKADGEQAVRDELADHLILRTTVVFSWDPHSKNFAMQVWERLSHGEAMRVPRDQIGNPTLADFLAESSVELVERGVRGETVNVVGRDRVPRTEFAVRLARRLDLDPGLIQPITTPELQQRAPRPLNAGLKTDKLAALLGRPVLFLDDALDRFVQRKEEAQTPS
jgi:dTDP-4-dehydrorhamnose reductase